jgi:hypothetical protein
MTEITEEVTDRGFVHLDPVETRYGAIVHVYESSAAMGPHIWMNCKQPPPAYPGALPQELGEVPVHMNLAQAEAIRDRLTHLIDKAKREWAEEAWYYDDE